jgi:hypothetical protein
MSDFRLDMTYTSFDVVGGVKQQPAHQSDSKPMAAG